MTPPNELHSPQHLLTETNANITILTAMGWQLRPLSPESKEFIIQFEPDRAEEPHWHSETGAIRGRQLPNLYDPSDDNMFWEAVSWSLSNELTAGPMWEWFEELDGTHARWQILLRDGSEYMQKAVLDQIVVCVLLKGRG